MAGENEIRIQITATDKGAKAKIEEVGKAASKSGSSFSKMGAESTKAGAALDDYSKYAGKTEGQILAMIDAEDRAGMSGDRMSDSMKQMIQVEDDHAAALKENKARTDQATEATKKSAAAHKKTRWAVGLASGAVAGLVAGLVNQVAAYALSIAMGERARKEQESFAKTLDKTTAAITDQTRETVIHALAENDVLQVAKRHGVALDLVTEAALGNADAQRKVYEETMKLIAAGEINLREAEILTDGTMDRARSLEVSTEKVELEAEATRLLTDDLHDEAAARERATDAIDDYQDAMRAATDPVFAFEKATTDVKEAQEDYNVAVTTFGKDSVEANQALFDLADAQLDMNYAANEAVGHFDDAKLSLEELAAQGRISGDALEVLTGRIDDLDTFAQKIADPYVVEYKAGVDEKSFIDARAYVRSLMNLGLLTSSQFLAAAGGSRGAGTHAAGGIIGARGGIVNDGGPEFVNVPGAHVTPAGQTAQMLAGGGGGGTVQVVFGSDGSDIGDFLLKHVRKATRQRGGNVQKVIGS